jgi:putative colanic acid biosynthesis acetyltransferase WcaF
VSKSVDLSKFNNSWYKPGNAFKRGLWYFVNAVFMKKSWFPISGFKRFLLRLFGAKIGKGVVIKPCVNIKYPWKLNIGDHVWIGENVWIDNLDTVTIGNNCCLSQGAFLLCGNHDYKSASFDLKVSSIVLEDGVWIGAKAIICPGVTAGTHAVLTVGSVATKNLDPYAIYTGNPAIRIKDRTIER